MAAHALPPPPHVAAVRVEARPSIDGKLDEPVWARAKATTSFTQKYPNEAKPPSEQTTMRIIYDDDAIYVGFSCEQLHAGIVPHLSRRDRLVEADRVEIDIGTKHDRKSAFQFSVNAGGVLTDAVLYNDTDSSGDWDENWEAQVARTETGWSAEIRIPLRILRFNSASVQSWDLQARRFISEKQEIDEWAYIPRETAGEVSHYGYLDDLRNLISRTPLELKPFVVGKLQRRDAATTQLAKGIDVGGSAGLDAKWHPTQSLTLDATINPDFGQVEADQQVLNLTTYETYYPEKRPFFLEGIDTFSTPRQLLYTRRIGRAAPAPNLRLDPAYSEQLVDVPQPAQIYGALKLTGQVAPGWTLGLLQAASGKNSVEVQLADGSRSARAIDPLTYYSVMRLKRDVGHAGYVGLMTTMVARAEETGAYPTATPYDGGLPPATQLCPGTDARGAIFVQPGARCFNDAYVGSLDWNLRWSNAEWVTGGQLIGTLLKNGPVRVIRDGVVIRPGDVGTGAFAYVRKDGGGHWVGLAALEYEGRKLEYDDLGYNQRANDYRWRLDVEWREMSPWKIFREQHYRGEIYGRTNIDGLLIGSGYQINTYGTLSNFWQYYTELHFRPPYFDDREVGDGTALERAGLVGFELELASNPAKPVSFSMQTQTQALTDGVAFYGTGGLLFRALPALDLELLPTIVYSKGEPRYTGEQASGQYIFGRLEAASVGTILRATYAFLPRLTLQAYAQLFLAAGHYSELSAYSAATPRNVVHLGALVPFSGTLGGNPDFVQGAINANVVLRWEYALGSTLYVVYSRSQVPSVTLAVGESGTINFTPVSRAPAADVFLVKLAYFWAG